MTALATCSHAALLRNDGAPILYARRKKSRDARVSSGIEIVPTQLGLIVGTGGGAKVRPEMPCGIVISKPRGREGGCKSEIQSV